MRPDPDIASPSETLASRPAAARDAARFEGYEGSDLEALLVLRRYRDWILDEFRPYLRGEVAEIGAGIGSFSQAIQQAVTALEAIEPSAPLFPRLQANLDPRNRMRARNTTAEAWLAGAAGERYDAIVMVNVLEHIADDTEVLRQSNRVLRRGGHLLLFVPALMALYSPLDRLVGHYRRYHKAALRAQVENAGFAIRHCRYFDALGVLPWLVVNRLGGARRFNPTAAALYDAIGVPIARAIERHISPPLGKNLLLVAERTDA